MWYCKKCGRTRAFARGGSKVTVSGTLLFDSADRQLDYPIITRQDNVQTLKISDVECETCHRRISWRMDNEEEELERINRARPSQVTKFTTQVGKGPTLFWENRIYKPTLNVISSEWAFDELEHKNCEFTIKNVGKFALMTDPPHRELLIWEPTYRRRT